MAKDAVYILELRGRSQLLLDTLRGAQTHQARRSLLDVSMLWMTPSSGRQARLRRVRLLRSRAEPHCPRRLHHHIEAFIYGTVKQTP